jgi:hypothetical protein
MMYVPFPEKVHGAVPESDFQEMHDIMVANLPEGCRLTVSFETTFLGTRTLTDLSF